MEPAVNATTIEPVPALRARGIRKSYPTPAGRSRC